MLVLPRSDASASGILSENEAGKRVGLPFEWRPSVCTSACWSCFVPISLNENFPSCTFEILLCVGRWCFADSYFNPALVPWGLCDPSPL
jgi:hypothetical protein